MPRNVTPDTVVDCHADDDDSKYLPSEDDGESQFDSADDSSLDSFFSLEDEEGEDATDLDMMMMDGILDGSDDCDEDFIVRLKELERRLATKVSSRYFRCKVKHKRIYEELRKIHADSTTDKLLKQINHSFDTQGVEAMNKSCSAFATKGETFSKTMSLTTRLEVACAAQIVGHHELWRRMYKLAGMVLEHVLSKSLSIKDKNKGKRHTKRTS